MTESSDQARTRISDAERDTALTALGVHMRAGRLDPVEYSDRATAVGKARFFEDLVPLFQDLPFSDSMAGLLVTQQSAGLTALEPTRPAWQNPARIMPVLGPLCLILFFIFGFLGGWAWSWIFFLVPGLVAAILFGDEHSRNRRDHRRTAD